MKFTNIKQLIIKFMGGGIINFPTRFLRWVKIVGDTDGSDDGGNSGDDSGEDGEFKLLNNFPLWGEIYGFCINRYQYDVEDDDSTFILKENFYEEFKNYITQNGASLIPITIIYKYKEELVYNNGNYIEGFYDKIYYPSLIMQIDVYGEIRSNGKLMIQIQNTNCGNYCSKTIQNGIDCLMAVYTGD